MKILFFAGSLRTESFNKKLAREAKRLVDEKGGHETEFLDLRDYPMPIFDQDIQDKGFPETVTALGKKMEAFDGIILASPEYNASIPAPLKNTIDWLSRLRPMPFAEKPLLLIGTSLSPYGAVRGLWQVRIPFEMCNVHIYPGMMALPFADKAFDEQGRLKEDRSIQQLQKLLDQFLKHIA